MREKILKVICDAWCDNNLGAACLADREIQTILQDMNQHFDTDVKNSIYIERQMMSAICAQDRLAFMAGMEAGLALVTGSFWR